MGLWGLRDWETFTSLLVLIWSRIEVIENHYTLTSVHCLCEIN